MNHYPDNEVFKLVLAVHSEIGYLTYDMDDKELPAWKRLAASEQIKSLRTALENLKGAKA